MASIRDDFARWGVLRTIHMRVMHRLERHVGLHLFVINSRRLDANAAIDTLPEGCSVRVLSQIELSGFCQREELGLVADSVTQALARGDICFGYVEQGNLVAYTWIGTTPTPMEAGLWVEIGPHYSFGYKALTLPSHRGRHLQECLVHAADRWLTSHGYLYNIDHIRTHNFPSIVADRRYGNRAMATPAI